MVVALSLAASATASRGWETQEGSKDKAILMEQQGQNAEAEAAWGAYLKGHPASAEAYAHMGLLEARQEHYADAVPLYRKALALNPAMPGLKLNLGLSQFKAGLLKDAVLTFQPLLKAAPAASPEAARLTALIGLARYGIGQYAEAVPYLKKATANDAQNLPFRLALAHSCLAAKQYPCVLDTYREILTLNAESAEADMLAGEAMDEMRDHAGATEQFRAAIKADPKVPGAHFGLGYLLWTQLQYEEAAENFQAELANDPNHAQAMAYLADAQIRLGNSEKARPLLEKANQLNPGMELVHLDLGILDADAGQQADALKEFKTAVRLSPEDINAHFRLARLYKSMGNKEMAKVEFDKTGSLTKAAEASVFSKLEEARTKGATEDSTKNSVEK
jgi:tetratricopeptide (TPR) repeat protein